MFQRLVYSTYWPLGPGAVEAQKDKTNRVTTKVWWFTNMSQMILTAVSIVSEAGLLHLLADSGHFWGLPGMCRGVNALLRQAAEILLPFKEGWAANTNRVPESEGKQWRAFYRHWGWPDSQKWDSRCSWRCHSGLYWLNHPHCEAQLSFDDLELKLEGLWPDAEVSSLMIHQLLCF